MSDARLDAAVAERLDRCDRDRVVERLWARDVAVWGGDAATPELGDRLGWLDLPSTRGARLPQVIGFADEIRTAFDRVVLCGMGGSSLAPEVLWRTFGVSAGYPSLHLLDSTHPDAVRGAVPGQFHEGGPARGHFLQVMAPAQELPIPGKPYGSGRLIEAQAHGDRAALVARARPVMRLASLDALQAAVA